MAWLQRERAKSIHRYSSMHGLGKNASHQRSWPTAPHMPERHLKRNSIMTLSGFEKFKRYFQASDPAEDMDENAAWLLKIAPAPECMHSSSRRCYWASETVSVDKMIASFAGIVGVRDFRMSLWFLPFVCEIWFSFLALFVCSEQRSQTGIFAKLNHGFKIPE